jgi:16S rRNA (uracil1498-N3)-methyltransferase
MAVAAPRSTVRQRFVVEKLAELGARRLVWLEADFGSDHPRKPEKVRAWAIAGLEQSRGAYLLEVGEHEPWEDLDRPLSVAVPGAGALADVSVPPSLTLAIGPEGGFAADEVPVDAHPVGLGNTVLRVETAAVAAAALLLAR